MRKKGNWTVASSSVIYENQWISVVQDDVIRPDGKDGIFSVVNMRPGASVLPIDAEGNVYLTREYKYAIEADSIEVISGGKNENETYEETAARELREETGITAGRIVPLGFINPFTTAVNSPNYMFLALDLKLGEASPDATEILHILKTPFLQAFEWANDGTITHGASVVLILKAKAVYEELFAYRHSTF